MPCIQPVRLQLIGLAYRGEGFGHALLLTVNTYISDDFGF